MSLRTLAPVSVLALWVVGQGCAPASLVHQIPGVAPAAAERPWQGSLLPDETRGALSVPTERPRAAPASRTHEDDPLARRVGPPPIAGLEPRNGALVGAALGVGVGMAVGRDVWNRPLGAWERAANGLLHGSVGAATGALAGAFGRDPYALLWPVRTAVCEGSLPPSVRLPDGRRATGPAPTCTIDLLDPSLGRM